MEKRTRLLGIDWLIMGQLFSVSPITEIPYICRTVLNEKNVHSFSVKDFSVHGDASPVNTNVYAI